MIEWKGAAYADIASLQRWVADRTLSQIAFRGNERVLDVGCGDGRITDELCSRVPDGSVTGVDVSHDMIAFAQSTHRRPNLSFAVCDALAIDTLPQRHDLVISFNALHWVHDQVRALDALFGALVPGGLAEVQMVGHGERTSLEHVIRETCGQPRWAGWLADHARPYAHVAPDRYAEMARAAGFEAEVTQDGCQWDFKTREAFVKWAEGTFVFWTLHLPPAEVDAFIREVLDRYAGSDGQSNVFYFYQMVARLKRPAHG